MAYTVMAAHILSNRPAVCIELNEQVVLHTHACVKKKQLWVTDADA